MTRLPSATLTPPAAHPTRRLAWRWRPVHFAAIVLGSALVSWLGWSGGQPAWSGLDRLGWDFAFRARGPMPPEKVAAQPQTRDIVCVQTSHTLPRHLLAQLVRKLSRARAVALDFMLVDSLADLEPGERVLYRSEIQRWKHEDALLAAAIKSNGHVLLALWPEDARLSSAVAAPAAPAAPRAETASPAARAAAQAQAQGVGADDAGFDWRRPAPRLTAASRGLGHVVITQEGGVLRRVQLWQGTRRGAVPCMGLALAALASNQTPQQFASGKSWRLESGSATIDWLGGREIFEQLDNSIDYEQALEWEPEDFAGKIVVVGEVSRQSKEIVLTPWGEAPAMQAHATIAAMLLAPNGPPSTPSSSWTLALCVLASTAVLAPLWRLGLWGCFAILLLQSAAIIASTAWLFAARHVLLPGSAPIGAGVLAFNLLALYEYRRTRHTLSRFIGPEMIARALDPFSTLEPGEGEGREEEATAFFCDLRGYSTLSEKLSPRETALLVNDYTTLLLRATHKSGGRVIDYQGDGMFVLFEARRDKMPRPSTWGSTSSSSASLATVPDENRARQAPPLASGHATRAVQAALEVMRQMHEFNARWEPVTGRQMSVGIGLQSGLMQIGIIGSADRVHFGALGDPVNVASRVQEFSKTLPASIIIAGGTHQALQNEGSGLAKFDREFEMVSFGSRGVRGRVGEVPVWGVWARQDAAS